MTDPSFIDPTIPPSGIGCVECIATDGWWFHLRRCAACGHIGCCDSSPSQHASHHAVDVGHPIVASFEPGASTRATIIAMHDDYTNGPALVAPVHHPLDQTTPGPEDRVPDDWQEHLH